MSNTKNAATVATVTKSNKVVAADRKRVTADASKANAKRTAQPGIISSIMHMLCDARDKQKPTTTAAMLASLSKKFADREVGGLQTTLRAQLSRLPHERKFGIAKQRDGVTVYYAATATAKRDAAKVA